MRHHGHFKLLVVILLLAPGLLTEVVAQAPLRSYTGCCGYGWAVATSGDLDGDGRRDFLVGANGSGAIYAHSSADATPLWIANLGGGFGSALASAGDVDGDGIEDVIGGDPNTASGRALLLSGADGSVLRELERFGGTPLFGYAVSALGDIDGDGRSDVLVGAPGGNGAVHLISGADGRLIATVNPPVAGGAFGAGVAGVDDLDRDGIREFIVGAPLAAGGRAYVFSGASRALLFTLAPELPNGRFGEFFVADAGDYDGDGWSDLYVGAYAEVNNSNGAAYVFSGRDGSRLVRIAGAAGEGLGPGRGAGDVDGDGFDDLIVGSYSYSGAGVNQGGRVSLYRGGSANLLAQVNGTRPGGQFGFDAVGLGDVAGEGRLAFIVASAPANAVDLYVAPLLPANPAFAIDDGLSGAWSDPASAGQGLFLDVAASDGVISAGWFTYPETGDTPEPGLRWFVLSGKYLGDRAELVVFATRGGAFDDPREVESLPVGSVSLRFGGCGHAELRYVVRENAIHGSEPIDAGPVRSGRMSLLRVTPNVFCGEQ